MTKCKKCCKSIEEYKKQFPTTFYFGKLCSKCGEPILKEFNL